VPSFDRAAHMKAAELSCSTYHSLFFGISSQEKRTPFNQRAAYLTGKADMKRF
jgi:hypothetical protein